MPGQYDRSNKTTRAYSWSAGQHLATAGAAAVRSAAIAAIEVCLCATVAGYVKVGDNAVTATAGAERSCSSFTRSGSFIYGAKSPCPKVKPMVLPAVFQPL